MEFIDYHRVGDIKKLFRTRWTHIIVHHTEDPNVRDAEGNLISKHFTPEVTVYHREVRGWKEGLGYHFTIEADGTVYEGGRWMRQLDGAHTKDMNHCSIGVAMMGNFDIYDPTPEQFASLLNLLKELVKRFDIDPDNVQPHRAYSPKSCPGKRLSDEWFSDIRKLIA